MLESVLSQVTKSISTAIQALTVGNAAFSVFAQTSLGNMWAFINSLQLILHLPMNKVSFPESTFNFIEPLIKVVTFDLTEILDLVGLDIELFSFTETLPFNKNFDQLGYGSQNTIDNLGFINLVIAYFVIEVLVYFLLVLAESLCSNCCTKKLREKIEPHSLSNNLLRFMLEALLEIMFVCMISLVESTDAEAEEDSDTSVKTTGDKFMICYTVFLLLATLGFVCALFWYIVTGFKNLQRMEIHEHEEEKRKELFDLYKEIFGIELEKLNAKYSRKFYRGEEKDRPKEEETKETVTLSECSDTKFAQRIEDVVGLEKIAAYSRSRLVELS